MRHMTSRIADKLTSHLEPVNNIPWVNRGGCGVVALNLYKKLVDLDYNARIVSVNPTWASTKERYHRRQNNKGFGVSGHYVVRVDGLYFDSSGPKSYKSLCDMMWESELNITSIFKADLEWAVEYGDWNPMFFGSPDREKHIKFIEDHIGAFNIGNIPARNNRQSARSHRVAGEMHPM